MKNLTGFNAMQMLSVAVMAGLLIYASNNRVPVLGNSVQRAIG